ncbi:hypothetical protein B0H13DRAFT_649679 [Mycena leptocephala]|jgi:hypothetical protein|nr:hypothetical protein B0H13DRAFT_649679 [Mycena leptocephala]
MRCRSARCGWPGCDTRSAQRHRPARGSARACLRCGGVVLGPSSCATAHSAAGSSCYAPLPLPSRRASILSVFEWARKIGSGGNGPGAGGGREDRKRSERADGGRRNGSCNRCQRVVRGASVASEEGGGKEEGHADGRPECGSPRGGISRAVRGFSFWRVLTHLAPRLPPSRLLASRLLVCRSTFHTASTLFHSPPSAFNTGTPSRPFLPGGATLFRFPAPPVPRLSLAFFRTCTLVLRCR